MKKFLILLIVLLLSVSVFAGATRYNIRSKPTERWLSGSVLDPAWGWMKEIDNQVAASAKVGPDSTIRYVNSNVTNAGDSLDWSNAASTLNAAINLGDANDIFYLAPGHTEAMGAAADEVDVDIAGVWIEGLGTGSDMATFDYTGDVTGAFAVGADNVTFVNIRFKANITDVNEAVDIEAGSTNWRFINCVFDVETEGTDEFLECIDSPGAASDRGEVLGCQFLMGAGACNAAISHRDVDYGRFIGNEFHGDYAVAPINNVTTASNHMIIEYNKVFNGTIGGNAGLNAQPCIEMVATTTGIINHNMLVCNVATPDLAVVAADMFLGDDNVYSENEATSVPPMWLTTDTSLNIIGYDDNNNAYSSTNVAANADGTLIERLEQIEYASLRTITATTDFTASTDVIFTVAGGAIEIVSMFGQCTTLAGGSPGTMTIEVDATAGADYDNDLSTTVNVDALGAGDTIRFTNAIDEGVLTLTANTGAGQTLSWFSPAGDIEQTLSSTGTGAVKWYMTYRPLDTGVTVTAP